jgi:hypothetical protein
MCAIWSFLFHNQTKIAPFSLQAIDFGAFSCANHGKTVAKRFPIVAILGRWRAIAQHLVKG